MRGRTLWTVLAALVILVVMATGGNAQTTSPSASGKIVFVSGHSDDWQVYLMNIDESDLVQLTHSPGTNTFYFQPGRTQDCIHLQSRRERSNLYDERRRLVCNSPD